MRCLNGAKLIFAIAFFAVSAQAKEIKANTKAASNNQKVIQELFNYENIGNSINVIERKIGKPIKNVYGLRDYKINGCKVSIAVDGEYVSDITLYHSKTCGVNLKQVMPSITINKNSNDVSFKDLQSEFIFESDCISGCGNAVEPSVLMSHSGVRFEGFAVLSLSTYLSTDAALDATDKLVNSITNQFGEEVFWGEEWKCSKTLTNLGPKYFANLKFDSISLHREEYVYVNKPC